ncbi:MAG: phosphatidate cytidylyltransferase [Bacteroidia bacterium]|nr:phosphatidate cytidylyltransferase [Bacteroidia bacterium]
MSSCSAVAGIFKVGMGVGIFIVVAVIIVIAIIAMRVSKK